MVPATVDAICFGQAADIDSANGSAPAIRFPGSALFNDAPPFLAGVLVDHADHQYQGGDLLKITFQAEETAWLYLLYHQADSQTLLLFPNRKSDAHQIPKGTKVQVPPDDQSFRFRIQKPFGREVLQVLASTNRIPELEDLLTEASGTPVMTAERLAVVAERLSKEKDSWTEHRVSILTVGISTPAEPLPIAAPAERFGLFVGIGEYQHPEFVSTHVELQNSAKLFHQQMTRSGGIDPTNSRLLLNEQANRTGIEESITKWLPAVTKPGDVVFVYFSGHAGQYESHDRSEPDGLDEALCPWDFDAGTAEQSMDARIARAKSTSILDDTLARWLQELSGRQVVLVLDTCFSGGFVKEKKVPIQANLLANEAARVKDISQMNIIVLSSCASDEQSQFEGTANQTMWFTYCLSDLFENPETPKPLTVDDAFVRVRKRMKQLLTQANAAREQEPTMTDSALLPVLLIP
jgi:hypothetical protein